MRDFDPRLTPVRADLAAKELQGEVTAPRYVEGRIYEVVDPQAPLRSEPAADAPLATEAIKGELVTVYDINGEGWAWGQLRGDGYVGWLPANALALPGVVATHKVTALRTFAFPKPSIKTPPLEALPFGSRLAVARLQNDFGVTSAGTFVPAVHLAPIGQYESDYVAVAERFIGAPYLWGGKTMLGLDCSGLVQVALSACGMACPRDSDMQQQALGFAVSASSPKRGDLLFWSGHVGIVRDANSLLHANAFHMAVVIEPLTEAIVRIRAAGSELAGVRRLQT